MADSINFDGYSISFNDTIYKHMLSFIENNPVFTKEWGKNGAVDSVSYKIPSKEKGYLHMEELSLKTDLFRRIYVNTGEDDKNIIDIAGFDKLPVQQRAHIRCLLQTRAKKTLLENKVVEFFKQNAK